MRHTFFRVFLMILVANIVVVGAGMMLVEFTEKHNKVPESLLSKVGIELIERYEKYGLRALRDEVRKAERKLDGRIALFQENGLPLTQRSDRDNRERDDHHDEQDKDRRPPPAMPSIDERSAQFLQIRGVDGSQYLLVFRQRPQSDLVGPHFFMGLFFVGVLLSSGILAWWLLTPLRKLRTAVTEFGRSDMSARLSGRLIKRRDAFGDLARDFNDMSARIEGLMSSKERLLRDVSHELRTPLARIEVALTIAEDRHGQAAQEKYLSRIRSELHELDELIGQVLSLSRLEAASLKKQTIEVLPWLDSIIDDVAFECQLKNLSIERVGDKPTQFIGDPLQLRHAIENVLRNACFYVGQEGQVQVDLSQQGDHVQIAIKDNGPGVEEDKLEKIFHAFYRSSDAREAHSGGYGVGLAIAKRIVDAHHGSLQAYNRDAGGLAVVFSLPID